MPAGRPKKTIDYDLAEKLARIQCTQAEIASMLGISVDTLHRNKKFCGIYKKAMDEGRSSLRRMQWKAATDGNATMQIWLGKQYLHQTDKPIEDTTDQLKKVVDAINKNINTESDVIEEPEEEPAQAAP